MNYVRLITPTRRVRRVDADCGPFGPAYDALWDPRVPRVLQDAIWHEIDWFEQNLPVPYHGAFRVKSRKRWYADGICWFVAEAREMIEHAFVLAALLRDIGVPVRKVATRRPGTILYRDRWQIVAKPVEVTPTLFC
jgi:hypothetical protein